MQRIRSILWTNQALQLFIILMVFSRHASLLSAYGRPNTAYLNTLYLMCVKNGLLTRRP